MKSFDEAVNVLTSKYENKIETMYAIGGSSIYREALTYPSDMLHRIYLTRVFSSDTQCDVFLEPANFLESFEKINLSKKEWTYIFIYIKSTVEWKKPGVPLFYLLRNEERRNLVLFNTIVPPS